MFFCGAKSLEAQQTTWKVYETVGQSDTLGSIALEYGVSVRALKHWNGLNSVGDLQTGMRLLIKQKLPPKPRKVLVFHTVKSGENIQKIAEHYGVDPAKIREWNNEIDSVTKGEKIKLYVPDIEGYSVSIGRASDGTLKNGFQFTESTGLEVHEPKESYGTRRVIRMMKAAVADVQARWPEAPEISVWDLSYEKGGHFSPHKSHQSGRDIDVSYYQKQDADRDDDPVDRIDPVRSWYLFTTLIETGEVEYIFIAYPLQKVLYEYARSVGYTKKQLKDIIQYPRPKSERVGIIREVGGGHDTHAHIRFKCAERDRNCH